MKLWDARFSKAVDQRVNDFNSSISVDYKMYKQDIKGSIAHVTMLAKQGIIEEKDCALIKKTLVEIEQDIDSNALSFDPEAEDIHMFIESELTKRIHDVGKRLHTARSRNDQVALDFRMYSMDEAEKTVQLLIQCIHTLCDLASANTETIMPGYTHLQRAQPISFAHHLMAYSEMFQRDILRLQDCKKRCNISPLGCAALASTTYPIDRAYSAQLLGFDGPCMNSLDGVSDRDFAIEYASALSTIMMHLSRLSEEVILWSSWEFKFIDLDDAFATGSSIMPQKKNPDICELIRGKSGRVFANLQTLLVMMKGLPLAYNKDMQEDKEALFDSFENTQNCLITIIPMLETIKVNKENMRLASAKGFINATDLADYLTKKGLPFRDSYKIVGSIVAEASAQQKTLEDISLETYQTICPLFEEDIYEAIALETCVNKRNVLGGPAKETVLSHIAHVQNFLKEISHD